MSIDRTPLNVITLSEGDATPRDIIMRALPAAILAGTTIFLYAGDASSTIILRDPTAVVAPSTFPTQYSGLRYYKGGVVEICLVATADAPVGMGGQVRVHKNGTTYAVYLVETTDPNASGWRIETTAGVKAARLKT